MSNTQYDQWIKSHQMEIEDIDLSDSVMSRITRGRPTLNLLRRERIIPLLNVIQDRIFLRPGLFACGALFGLIRIFVQMYVVLFT